MKSNDVNDHGMPDGSIRQVKKPWVTPSLEVISLESAEHGGGTPKADGNAGKFSRTYS